MSLANAAEILKAADDKGLRRVLIVTALPLEMKAVRVDLQHLGSCIARDGNVFELGQFGGTGDEWLAVVAESGAGNDAAQGVVTTAARDFGPFELAIFVGVAASRKKFDAPIGSVVVSNHVYSSDNGKYEGGHFLARAREFPVDTRLVGLARKVARDERWHERLKPPYGGKATHDELYPKPFPPAAIVAPIISVGAVSADLTSVLEQHITKTYQDAVGLEMEGYGAMFAAHSERMPTIIVRGISDMREGKDPQLDKFHQPIAAGHGAAFGFELLDMWGQNYPAPERRRTVSATSPAEFVPSIVALPPGAETPEQQNQPGHVKLVLNFRGGQEDFPQEKRDRIVQALREVTGNPDLQLEGAEVGSFRMLLRALETDQAKIDRPEVYNRLAEEFEAHLLGVMNEAEYSSVSLNQSTLLVASGPLLEWPQTLPDGTKIDRPELQKLISLVDGTENSTTALIGPPGSGKTALLAALAHSLKTKGIPFLGIKADLIDPGVTDEEGLRKFLDLPITPSLALSRLALLRPTVLIIDQLDALASYVDLRTGRLSVLLNLVRQLGLMRNIHVVLSARTFEYEHDTRLKTVRAEGLTLELPPWSDILQILETNGVKAAGWPTDAQQVLRSPQALATFLKLANRTTTEPFATYQAMLEQLWRERILARPNGGRIAILAGAIAEDMAEKETLWLSSARYDAQADDLKSLVSNGILIHPGATEASIGFSHQTIFEYALARSFAQKEGRLSSYVLERESSLFMRPKLWAALTYLRAVEQPTYATELKTIWSSTNLRRHLRHLLIEFLGQQSAPTQDEATILEAALRSSDRRVALHAILSSPGWFERLKRTAIPEAMSNADEANVATGILARAWSFALEEVTSLITSKWLTNKDFDGYAWSVLQDCPVWRDEHLEIAGKILSRTPIASFAFEHTVSTVGVDQPIVAMKLALIKLEQDTREALKEAERRATLLVPEDDEERLMSYHERSPWVPLTKLVERSDGWDGLEALAKQDPGNFLAIFWPWFKELLSTLALYEERKVDMGFPLVHTLDFRFDEEDSLGLGEYPLLGALRTAMETLATTEGEAFLAWFKENEKVDASPAQRLFAHVLTTLPEIYAARALEFLLTDKKRFHLGSMEDYSGTTKRLVKAVSPYWNDDQLGNFVNELMSYAPSPGSWRDSPKLRRYFHRDIDTMKLELLEELPKDRLTTETLSYIRGARRRFGKTKRGGTFSHAQWIGSPMSSEQLGLASDDDVINAFRELPDATGWDNPKTWMKGGNIQLSRAFAEFAKTSPERATEIIRRFDASIGTRAAGYALDAMAETAQPDLVLGLIADLEKHGFAGEEYRGNAARAIERLIRRNVPIRDETLALVTGWLSDGKNADALEDDEVSDDYDDNSLDKVLPAEATSKSKDREESILWGMGGISILPHGNFPVLEVIIRIFLQRQVYDQLLRLLIEHLDRPEEEKVWASLFRLFRYIRPANTSLLVVFLTRLFEKYPGLAATRESAVFLAYMHWTVPDFVHTVLNDWKSRSAPLVQQAFGELATLVWLTQPKLTWPDALVEELLAQSAPHARIGAAYAAVNVWAETDNKERASRLLERIIPMADNRSWSAVVDLFRLVDDITPDSEWIRLLKAIAEHIPAQESFNSTFVVERLQTLLPHEAMLVATIANALVAKWREELGDIRTGTATIAPELIDIAITLHRLGPETRVVGIELFEDLLEVNAYTASETLDQIDNRFRNTPLARARLPRRSRSKSKRANRRGS